MGVLDKYLTTEPGTGVLDKYLPKQATRAKPNDIGLVSSHRKPKLLPAHQPRGASAQAWGLAKKPQGERIGTKQAAKAKPKQPTRTERAAAYTKDVILGGMAEGAKGVAQAAAKTATLNIWRPDWGGSPTSEAIAGWGTFPLQVAALGPALGAAGKAVKGVPLLGKAVSTAGKARRTAEAALAARSVLPRAAGRAGIGAAENILFNALLKAPGAIVHQDPYIQQNIEELPWTAGLGAAIGAGAPELLGALNRRKAVRPAATPPEAAAAPEAPPAPKAPVATPQPTPPVKAAAKKPTPAEAVAKSEAKVSQAAPQALSEAEFAATGETLHHGTNRQFEKLGVADAEELKGVKNRFGRTPAHRGVYFTQDAAIAQDFSEAGAYKRVDARKFAGEYNDVDNAAVAELRTELDKAIKTGKRVGYVDYEPGSPTEGRFVDVKSADAIPDEYFLNPEDADVRVYVREPRVITDTVYGRTLDLTDPRNLPDDLPSKLRKIADPDVYGGWRMHEQSPELIEYARAHGYGKIKVPDAYESGFQSIIALPEYIANGRTARQVASDLLSAKPTAIPEAPAFRTAKEVERVPEAPAVEAPPKAKGTSAENLLGGSVVTVPSKPGWGKLMIMDTTDAATYGLRTANGKVIRVSRQAVQPVGTRQKGTPTTAPATVPPVQKGTGSGNLGMADAGTAVMPRTSTLGNVKQPEPVKASAIARDLQEVFAPIRTGRFRERALGIFKVKPEIIRTAKANDLPVIAHEAGHHLQKLLWPQARTPKGSLSSSAIPREFWPEMSPLAYPGAKKKVVEGYAEYIRLYLTDPKAAASRAPKFHKFFEGKLSEVSDIRKVVLRAQTDIARWIDQPSSARVRGTISTNEPGTKRNITLKSLYTQWVDDLKPLEEAEKGIAKGSTVKAEKSAFKEAWRGRGVAGKAETWLDYGVTDATGTKVGKSLKEVLRPVAGDLDSFVDYAVSRHGLDVIKQKSAKAMPLEASDYQAVVDAAPKHYDKVMKELVDYQSRLLVELEDSGLLSLGTRLQMRSRWPNHVPLYRVFEDAARAGLSGSGKAKANLPQAIHRLKGSGRDIINPIESIVKDTYTMLNLAQRNRVMLKLGNLAKTMEGAGRYVEEVPAPLRGIKTTLGEILGIPEHSPFWADLGDISHLTPETVGTIFRPTNLPAGKENIVRVFESGKAKFYQLEPELYNTIMALDTQAADILTNILSIPATVLRAGATLTPEFAMRNPIRDMWSALVYSEYGLAPWDLAKGIFHAVKGKRGTSEMYAKWKSIGGAHAAMVSIDRNYLQGSIRKMMRTAPGEKMIDMAKHPLEALREISEFSEEATRLAEFGKGTRGGKETNLGKLIDATIDARDITIDFSRSGTAGKKANRLIAFFNATIGGTDKLIRELRAHPVRTSLRATAYITVPSVLLYTLNRKNPRYEGLSEWQKDLFWIIPTTKNGPLIRIPKPFELGLLFGALPERILRWIDDEDPQAFDDFAHNLWDAVSPGVIPTALKPWIDVISNRSYSGTPIIPRREQDMPKPLQYGPRNTALAIALGEQANLSPRQIDYMIRGYGGGLGAYGAQALSAGVEGLGITNQPPKPTTELTSYPIIRGFTVNEQGEIASTSRMYDELDRLREAKARAQAKIGPKVSVGQQSRLRLLEARARQLSANRKLERQVWAAQDSQELAPLLARLGIEAKGTIGEQKRMALRELKKRARAIVQRKSAGSPVTGVRPISSLPGISGLPSLK